MTEPFVFSVSVFCSQIFTLQLNLRRKKKWSDQCNFYSNMIVRKLYVKNYFFLVFFGDFNYLCMMTTL